MQDYIKKQRYIAVDRKQGSITTHKILAVKGKEVTIAVPPILSNDGSITVPMNDTSGLKVGSYLDFQFSYTIHNGKVNDYRCLCLGETPAAFIPKEGD